MLPGAAGLHHGLRLIQGFPREDTGNIKPEAKAEFLLCTISVKHPGLVLGCRVPLARCRQSMNASTGRWAVASVKPQLLCREDRQHRLSCHCLHGETTGRSSAPPRHPAGKPDSSGPTACARNWRQDMGVAGSQAPLRSAARPDSQQASR